MSSPTTDDMLKAKLADYLGHLETAASRGGDFLAQQVPDVVRELIAWEIAKNAMLVVLAMAMATAIILGARCFVRQLNKESFEYKIDRTATCGIAAIAMAVPVALFCIGVFDGLKCIIAPKLFVLDYVLTMVNPK